MRKRTYRSPFAISTAVLATALVVALPAHAAWARGNGWQYLEFPDQTAACGATTVYASGVSNEYYRESTLPDDTVQFEVRGSLVVTYETDAGASVTVNASGPGSLFVSPNGAQQVVSHGLNSFWFTPEQAAQLGVPQISVSAGPFNVTWHTDGTVSGHLGTIIRDICAELT
jgi:hypothetical protein